VHYFSRTDRSIPQLPALGDKTAPYSVHGMRAPNGVLHERLIDNKKSKTEGRIQMSQTDVTSFVNNLDLGSIHQSEIYGDQAPVLATPAFVAVATPGLVATAGVGVLTVVANEGNDGTNAPGPGRR
jgi:hypothetical protein